MELILADFLGPEEFGRAAEVPGELGHVLHVSPDGPAAAVSDLEVIDHALAKRCHGGDSRVKTRFEASHDAFATFSMIRPSRGRKTVESLSSL